jgi:hypothetical protein
LPAVCAALNTAGARYVLAGAQAGILWGHLRATRDIDVLIEPTEENAQRVLEGLEEVGFHLARNYTPAILLSRKVTVLTDPFYHVDVMTVAWSVHYRDAAPRARVFTVEGVEIPALSLDDLIASKRTGRVQDALDIEELEEVRRRMPR